MTAHAATHATHGTHEHHDLGFLRTYVFSTDHKMIGRQFLILGLLMMILGGLLALVVRWQLAWPETPIPGMSPFLPSTGGVLEPGQYNMAFTMHATIMVFFVIMPILAGGFGHSGMKGWVYVHTPEEYQKWAAENLAGGKAKQ